MGQRTQQELENEPLRLSSTSDASPPNEESYCLMRELINTYGCHGLIRLHTHKRADTHLKSGLQRGKSMGEKLWGMCDARWREGLCTSLKNSILWRYYDVIMTLWHIFITWLAATFLVEVLSRFNGLHEPLSPRQDQFIEDQTQQCIKHKRRAEFLQQNQSLCLLQSHKCDENHSVNFVQTLCCMCRAMIKLWNSFLH